MLQISDKELLLNITDISRGKGIRNSQAVLDPSYQSAIANRGSTKTGPTYLVWGDMYLPLGS